MSNQFLKDKYFMSKALEEAKLAFQKDEIPYKNRFIMKSARFGRVHAVQYDTITNKIIGAAAPDWEGSVKTF